MDWITTVLWVVAQLAFCAWYSRQALRFARALRFDSTIGGNVVICLSVLWPLAMVLVFAVRLMAPRSGPLFLTENQEKRLRTNRRLQKRERVRSQAELAWNDWNQRLAFVKELHAEAERNESWLDKERLDEQLEFLKDTEPVGPGGSTGESRARGYGSMKGANKRAKIVAARSFVAAEERHKHWVGFCNCCNLYMPFDGFALEGVCHECHEKQL